MGQKLNSTASSLVQESFMAQRIKKFPTEIVKTDYHFIQSMIFKKCKSVSQIIWTKDLRPWKKNRTLLVKHLKSACQAKYLTVCPRPKTLLVQHFCLRQALLSFACQGMFDCLPTFPILLVKHFFCICKTLRNCNISAPSNISTRHSCLRISNNFVVPCWTSNVWSFCQGWEH